MKPQDFDLTYWRAGNLPARFVFGGTDEVGRGPLAGPVVAAAVLWAPGAKASWQKDLTILQDLGITDSKKLSALKRKKILAALKLDFTAWQSGQAYPLAIGATPAAFAVAEVDAATIDQINILQASLQAMRWAVQTALDFLAGPEKGPWDLTLLADGKFRPGSGAAQEEAIIKGDQKSLTIALASIIAKEYRDHFMQKLDAQFPQYGWAKNAGYPTADHRQALQTYGPCCWHRKSFHGVRELVVP